MKLVDRPLGAPDLDALLDFIGDPFADLQDVGRAALGLSEIPSTEGRNSFFGCPTAPDVGGNSTRSWSGSEFLKDTLSLFPLSPAASANFTFPPFLVSLLLLNISILLLLLSEKKSDRKNTVR